MLFTQGLALDFDPSTYAFCVVGMTGMNHLPWLVC
jgi:hypothetical protein